MIDWNIQSRAHACQACQTHFTDKESFHTLLSDHRNAYERVDVCEQCWKDQYSQGATERKGYVSHWQGVYHAPVAAAPEAIQKDTAESLLRKLVEQNDPSHAAARFILAVMLERKRILKVKAQIKEDGRRIYIYEHGKSGDIFQIPDPELQLNQLEAVQRDVAQLLEHGLPNLPAPPSSAPAPEPPSEPAADTGAEPAPVPADSAQPAPAAPPETIAETST